MVEHILAVLKDLRALSEFPEEGATEIVLIASKFDLEREGARRDGGCEVAAAKGIDGPTETQNLLGVARKFVIRRGVSIGWCDGIEFPEGNWVNR